ncbi:MAG TPA: hypothetical protein VIM61_09370 [Chthoniobacterales bacterium]
MTRFLLRYLIVGLLFALLRAVERRFGFMGLLVAAGFLLVMPFVGRVVIALAR